MSFEKKLIITIWNDNDKKLFYHVVAYITSVTIYKYILYITFAVRFLKYKKVTEARILN